MSGENVEYPCNNQIGIAEDLTKEQFEFCLKFNDTTPSERKKMFDEMWESNGKDWPFVNDGWKDGNGIFEMEDLGEHGAFECLSETEEFQTWFCAQEVGLKGFVVPRNNHAVIWMSCTE